ncbi:MAG TPA: hypothetical protein VK658_10720, partial [Chryseolinea sp.]|nr:hypothetical protein [Chryseolinea sp.]
MLKGIFLFELDYRRSRSVTYVYFGVVFLVSFLVVVSPSKNSLGTVLPNSPYVLSAITALLSFVFTMITSAVMGVAIVRDFDYNMESILFSNQLRKVDYLMGRFWGSFVVLIFINSGIVLGLMCGFALGNIMPWDVSWKGRELLAFNAWHYLQPFLLFVIPNLFITGAFFFMSGALSRNSILIYTQGILLIVLYQLGNTFFSDVAHHEIAALIDPFGIQTVQFVARYWTPAEQNSMLLPIQGFMSYNRAIWICLGAAALLLTQAAFSFSVGRGLPIGLKSKVDDEPSFATHTPVVDQVINSFTYIGQALRLSVFYFRMIFKEIPFIAIVASGMLFLFINAGKLSSLYGTSSYPTTFEILKVLNSFSLFFLIIAIFYSGELVWKERMINFNLIMDALPIPSAMGLLSKFLGLALVYVVLLFILIVSGIVIQIFYGYYHFDLPVYFGTLYTSTLSFLILYTLLSMFVQVVINNKFLGFSICVLFFVLQSMLNNMGVEHSLLQFASGTLGSFSEMNIYGHFMTPFSWLKIYWLAFTIMLFLISVVFLARGSESRLNMRWKSGKQRLTLSLIIAQALFLAIFISAGAHIYYNTNIVNTFETQDGIDDRKGNYEKNFSKYEFLPSPKIVASSLRVDLFPSSRSFSAKGSYYLKNKSRTPIQEIHIQHPENADLVVDYIRFDRNAVVRRPADEFRYFIYRLDTPLAPGDSVEMSFGESYHSSGFRTTHVNTDIVFNGTFFSNAYFPSIGYNKNLEISDDGNRSDKRLRFMGRMPGREDSVARNVNLFGDDADRIRFEIVIGTERDQIALAPGYLLKSWTAEGRQYFHYRMDRPIWNFFSIVSARYAMTRDEWQGVNLEIYHHPGHEYNLKSMTDGMKDALTYYSANFGPYQFRQLRIMEFPRYADFAQSFANTIPFSEGVGFVLKVDDPGTDLDMAYYITAHEVAHQWWGDQVTEARVKGSGMLSEGMSQYSALMVMKHKFSAAQIERYLKYELD